MVGVQIVTRGVTVPHHLDRPRRHKMAPPALESNPSDDERVMIVVATLICTLAALGVT